MNYVKVMLLYSCMMICMLQSGIETIIRNDTERTLYIVSYLLKLDFINKPLDPHQIVYRTNKKKGLVYSEMITALEPGDSCNVTHDALLQTHCIGFDAKNTKLFSLKKLYRKVVSPCQLFLLQYTRPYIIDCMGKDIKIAEVYNESTHVLKCVVTYCSALQILSSSEDEE